ncbi:ATP-binding protein [Nonomuraea sp. NPDC050643]|uniref:ATP-binding protein n=1 Tax=Nonomuraea sp. NPDC050643 TaxID=3155660 RepID=UPI0033F64D86
MGRIDELARLRDFLHRVSERGGTLILRGEAGVGKSSLLAEIVAEAAEHELRVLSSTAVQAEIDLPFIGLDMLVRQLTGSAAVSEEDHPYRVALTVLSLLTEAAGDRPLLLAVEDAQ